MRKLLDGIKGAEKMMASMYLIRFSDYANGRGFYRGGVKDGVDLGGDLTLHCSTHSPRSMMFMIG